MSEIAATTGPRAKPASPVSAGGYTREPFLIGCEATATSPEVTPFNGSHHAGIQVLNTANFPVSKGPLAHVHR